MARKGDSLVDKVRAHLNALEAGKKKYRRADALMDEICREMKPGQSVPLNEKGKKATLVDRFAGKNSVSVGQKARRYEFEVTEN